MPTGLEPETNMGKPWMTKWNSDEQKNTIAFQQTLEQRNVHRLE